MKLRLALLLIPLLAAGSLHASLTVTAQGTLGSTPLSGPDSLNLAGKNFSLSATMSISNAASPTPTQVAGGGWQMTYQHLTISVVVGSINGQCTNATATITNNPGSAYDFLYLTNCSILVPFSASMWVSSGMITSVFPGAFPSSSVLSATSFTPPSTSNGSYVYYGTLNPTALSVSGTLVGTGDPFPSLTPSNANVTLNGTVGGQAVNSTVNVTTTSSYAVPYAVTYTPTSSWLGVSPANTTTPGVETITATPGSRPAGTYNGTATLKILGNDNGTPVNIAFNLTAPSVTVSAIPGSLNFVYQTGSSAPSPQNVLVTTSPTSATVTAATTSSWITFPGGSTVNSGSNLQIGVNTAGLSPGNYNGNVTLTAPGGTNSPSIAVSLTVSSLSVSPNSLTLTYTGGAPPTGTLNVTSAGGSVTFAASASSTGNWLSVSPTNGTATGVPTALTVSINPASLQPGPYSGSITVSSSGANIQVPVSLTVVGLQPSPSPLSFAYPFSSQQLTMATNSGTPLSYTAQVTSGASWLSVNGGSSASGTTGGTPLTVAVNTAGMAAGTYGGTITVTASGAANSPLPVTVNLTVPPLLTVNQAPLSFSFTQLSGTLPPSQNIAISSNGTNIPYTVSVQTASGGSWLSVSPTSGTLNGNANLGVTVTPGSLAPGTYNGTITVNSGTAANTPVSVPVSFTVTAAPVLSLQSNPLAFTMQQNGALPNSQPLAVNSTGGSVPFSAAASTTSGGSWLAVSPASGTTNQNVTVSIQANSLSPGIYNGSITITAPNASNSPVSVSVQLTVTPAPSLVSSAGSLSFSYVALSGNPPASQNLTITASNSSAIGYAAAASTTSGGNWLSVSSNSGTTGSTTLVVAATPGSLAPGTYEGAVTITASGVSNSPLVIGVTLSISAAPNLNLSSGSLSFAYQVGGQTPAAQTVTASSSGAALNFTTSNGGTAWLQVSPASGTTGTSGQISISVNPAGLTPNTYQGTVTLSSGQAGNSPQTVTVTLTVNPLNLSSSPASLSFTELALGALPSSQSLAINSSGTALAYTAAASTNSGGSWLAVSPASGNTGSGSLTVSITTSQLTAGDYSGQIVITAAGASNTPLNVPVVLHVSAAPTLTAAPSSLSFTYRQLTSLPAPQSVQITASNGSALPFTASAAVTTPANGTWLHVAPGSSTAGNSVSVSVDPTGLAAGTAYSGAITITAAGASNSPVTIPVSFTVTAAPNLTLGSSSVTFNYQTGAPTPQSQSVSVAASDSSNIAFSATVVQGAAWLTATPSGNTPGTVGIGINAAGLAGLAAGQYTGTVNVTSAAAGNSPQPISVTLNVTASSLSLSTSTIQFGYQTPGGSLPAGVPVTISSTGAPLNFTITPPQNANWLTISALSGTTGAASGTVTFSLNQAVLAGLSANTYQASVSISASGAPNPATLNITLVVSSSPSLQLSSLQPFTYIAGGTAPADQNITVGSSGSALNFSASVTAGATWLSVSQNSSTTSAGSAIAVHVTPGALAAGTAYNGTIHITSTNASNTPLDIPVSLTVVQLNVPAGLSFSFLRGGTLPPAQSLNVTTTPSLALAFNASTPTSWLNAITPSAGTTPANLSAALNQSAVNALNAGNYNGSVAVSAGGASASVPVSLAVTQTSLSLSAQPQSFSYQIGSTSALPSQQLTLNAAGGATIGFSAASSAAWLAVTASGATTPATLTLALTQAGVASLTVAGSPYQATVTITSPSAPTITATVNLTVTAPAISVSSANPFAYQVGGTLPAAQVLTVSTPGSALPNASVSVTGAAWLNAALGQTTTPAQLTLSMNQAALANLTPGPYQATVNVTVPGASNSPMAVPVTLNVSATPTVSFAIPSLTFNCQPGGSCTPQSSPVTVSGTSNSLTFTAAPSANWLQVNPTSGNAGGSITVSVNPQGLTVGQRYTGTVTLNSTQGVATGQALQVTLNMGQLPTLGTVQSSLSFPSMAIGGTAPAPLSLTVTSSGSTLSFTAATPAADTWLHVSPGSGDTTASPTLSVSVNPAGLNPGTYNSTVTISAAQSANASVSVPVSFTVTAATLSTSTPQAFAYTINGTAPASQTLHILLSSGSSTYNATVSGGSWLTVTPASGNVSASTPANASLSVNTAGLTAGNYQVTIQISSPLASSPVSVPVTLNVAAAPNLVSSAPSLTFGWQIGTAAPASQTVTLSSSSTTLNFNATATTSSGGSWLSVSPANGSTSSGTLTVSVATTGLTAGTYNGSIQVTSSTAGNSPLSIPVTLTVSVAPLLSVNPASLSFTYQTGGTAPASKTVSVTGGSGSFSIGTTGTWLSVTSSGSTPPATLTVSVNPASLSAATYNGSITLTPATGSAITIPVQFAVSTTAVTTVTGGDNLAFTYQTGSTAPAAQNLTIALSNNTPAPFALTTGAGTWLSVSPQNGTTPATLSVSVNPAGLATGNYSSFIAVAVTGASDSPDVVPVTLAVTGGGALTAAPSTLAFTWETGTSAPAPQIISLSSGGGLLNLVTSTSGGSWLAAASSGNTAPALLTVSVDPTGLTPGSYSGQINLMGIPAGAGSPSQVAIPVTMTVTSGNTLSVAPSALSYTWQVGGAQPASQSVAVSATGASALSYTATSNGGWLSMTPASGTTPGTFNVSVNPANLTPGTYSGSINLNTGDPASSLIVAVTLTVTAPPPGLTITPALLSFDWDSGGTPPAAQQVSISAADGTPGFIATASGGNWLVINPETGAVPGSLSVSINAAGLAPGSYVGSVLIAPTGGSGGSQAIPVVLTIGASVIAPPLVVSVNNAASGAAGIYAPGLMISIYGQNLGPQPGPPADPSAVTRVLFDGNPAPLIYAQNNQVNAIVPFGVAGQASTVLSVEYKGVQSAGVTLPLYDAAPGTFTLDGSGHGPGAILNQDGSINGPGQPAAPGSVIVLYGTGGGLTDPPEADGLVVDGIGSLLLPVAATVGGKDAAVLYAGPAPVLLAGLWQINLVVPPDSASGDLPVFVTIGRFTTQRVTVRVQ